MSKRGLSDELYVNPTAEALRGSFHIAGDWYEGDVDRGFGEFIILLENEVSESSIIDLERFKLSAVSVRE